MIDLKVEPEKKLLGESCWIALADDLKIRIDYLTRAQETEFRRLLKLWEGNRADPNGNHWIEYYFRAAVKEVLGFTIEGERSTLTVEHGLARSLKNDKGTKEIDVCAAFVEYGILEGACGLIRQRLEFGDIEKKSSESSQNLSSGASSVPTPNPSGPEAGSSTGSTRSRRKEKKTS